MRIHDIVSEILHKMIQAGLLTNFPKKDLTGLLPEATCVIIKQIIGIAFDKTTNWFSEYPKQTRNRS